VPSFVSYLDVPVQVPELGKVIVDIAFGGMWYAVVNASSVGLNIDPKEGKKIVRYGEMIKTAAREQWPVCHPSYEYRGCDILVFRGPPKSETAHASNAVVMSNSILDWSKPETWTGMIDRSPCGTGTCAVMATLWARGQLALGQEFLHESILGTVFKGKLIEETKINDIPAVIPEISGKAWITQFSKIVLFPDDPFPSGYTVGDIWG